MCLVNTVARKKAYASYKWQGGCIGKLPWLTLVEVMVQLLRQLGSVGRLTQEEQLFSIMNEDNRPITTFLRKDIQLHICTKYSRPFV